MRGRGWLPVGVRATGAAADLRPVLCSYALTTDQLPLHPRNSKLLHLRARCLYQQGSFPSAIKHLQEALRCDPDNNACAKDIRMIRKLEKGKQEGNAAFKGASRVRGG